VKWRKNLINIWLARWGKQPAYHVSHAVPKTPVNLKKRKAEILDRSIGEGVATCSQNALELTQMFPWTHGVLMRSSGVQMVAMLAWLVSSSMWVIGP